MISTRFQRLGLAGAAAFLLGTTGPAIAQGYIGAGAGITTSDLCNGISGPGVNCDDEDTGLKIFGGYKFTPNFAVEGAWIDLGEVSASGPGGSATAEADGFQIAAVGNIADQSAVERFRQGGRIHVGCFGQLEHSRCYRE